MIQNPITYLLTELKITIATALVMVAVFLVGVRLSTPYIPQALPGLKYWVEYQIKTPVKIDDLEVIWIGSKPAIRFKGMTLLDDARETPIIEAQNVDVLLSPLDSIINGRFIIDSVIIDGASMRLSPSHQGMDQSDLLSQHKPEVDIMGLIEQTDTPILQSGAAWIEVVRGLPIERVILKNSDVHILEPSGRSWPLTDVTAAISREAESIHMRAVATLLGAKPATFQVGADIEEAFSAPTGTLVFQGSNFALDRIENWFDGGIARTSSGTVDLSIWTGIDKGLWQDVKVSIDGKDIVLTEDGEQPLDIFSKVSGELLWSRAELGHHWTLAGRSFHFEHQLLKNWSTTRFVLEMDGEPSDPRLRFSAEDVQLDSWLSFLLRTKWLPTSVHEIIYEYQPEGTVDFINIDLAKLNQENPQFSLQFAGEHLGLTQPDIGYRFENIDVRVDMDESSGSIEVISPHIQYMPSDRRDLILHLENWQTQINWNKREHGWFVQVPWMFAQVGDGHVEASASAVVNRDEIQEVSALVSLDTLNAAEMLMRFPIGLENTNFRDWLMEAEPEGTLENITFLYRGRLKGFSDHEDTLRATAKIPDLALYFSPRWPRLSALNADFEIKDLTAETNIYEGQLASVFSVTGKAVVPDVDASNAFVVADFQTNGRLEDFPKAFEHTPIKETTTAVFETLSPIGELDLDLTINAAFRDNGPVTLRGLLTLDHAELDVTVGESPFHINNVTGDIAFSDTNLKAPLIKAQWGEHPFSTAINMTFSGEHPYMEVLAKSWLDAQLLSSWSGQPLPLTGASPFELTLKMPLDTDAFEGGTVMLTSDLVGMGIQVPMPFTKPFEQVQAFELSAQMQPSDVIGIQARYGDVLSAAGRLMSHENTWEPMGAHLHFGQGGHATYPQGRQLIVDGSIPTLNVQHWDAFVKNIASTTMKAETEPSSDEMLPIYEQLEPDISLDIGLLDVWGISVENLNAQVFPMAGQWKVIADAPMISGSLIIPELDGEQAITLNLTHLQLPDTIGGESAQPLEARETAIVPDALVLPPIQAIIDTFEWRDLTVKDFKASLIPDKAGYYYQTSTSSKPLSFDIQGHWGGKVVQEPMSVQGTVQTRDFGDLLRRLHTKSAIKDARGQVELDLAWLGGVTDFQLPTVSGTISTILKNGQVLGVEPGLGRILSLLNLSNIRRRLTLDFSDITKEGFAFDTINAQILCDKGVARTDNFELKGPIANIDFQGKIELTQDHEITAQMELTPNLEGSLSLAATIASGNPAIGALLWAFDKVIQNDIEIVRYRYALSGNWLDPQLEELEVIHEQTSPATQ